MLKRLVILAIAAFVAVSPLTSQPNQTADKKQQPATQSQPSILPMDSQNKQAGGQADQPKTTANAPKWYAAFEDADGMLVIVGILTCLVICWQSWETRKAAKGAQLAADASFAQIELMKNKERARLIIEPIHIGVEIESEKKWALRVSIEVSNMGESKAFNVYGCGSLWVQDFSALPTPKMFLPWIGDRTTHIFLQGEKQTVEIDSQLIELPMNEFKAGITNATLAVFLQGFVKYETMGFTYRIDYGRRWWYHGDDGDVSMFLRPEVFKGVWTNDNRQKNEEHEQIPSPT
jgi:hypothetical protein